jgi:hypothetical protein
LDSPLRAGGHHGDSGNGSSEDRGSGEEGSQEELRELHGGDLFASEWKVGKVREVVYGIEIIVS